MHVANTHKTGRRRVHFRNPARSENIDKGPQGLSLWKLGSWEKEVRNQTQGHGAESPRGRAGKPKGGELEPGLTSLLGENKGSFFSSSCFLSHVQSRLSGNSRCRECFELRSSYLHLSVAGITVCTTVPS